MYWEFAVGLAFALRLRSGSGLEMARCIANLCRDWLRGGKLHGESDLGLASGWPGALGNSWGSGPGVASCIGECCGNGPWGGQVHWRMLWDWPLHWDFAWGVALGWPGALGIYTGIGVKVASCIGNLVWDWPWDGQAH